MMQLSDMPEWQTLKTHARALRRRSLSRLFADNAARADEFSFEVGPLFFDFSKTHTIEETLNLLTGLAEKVGLPGLRERLFNGGIVNPSEEQPALHTALRAEQPPVSDADGASVMETVLESRASMKRFAEDMRLGNICGQDGKPFKHVIHLGIGGSALGPQLLMDAFKTSRNSPFDVHIVSNIDGAALQPVLKVCDPAHTLVIVASKTFTTRETMTNAETVMLWLEEGGIDPAQQHMVAVTANPGGARDVGIEETHILPFAQWVGGRYSLWSSVSLPAALAFGWETFSELLSGALEMDEHFRTAPLRENAPVIAALLDIWYGNFLNAESRAVFAYDERLRLLPSYLQQLETESSGKDRTGWGEPVGHATAPIVWGGAGTDCQHSVFQMLHQGTHLVPCEFVAVVEHDHDWDHHHRQLLANCLAQGAALMQGQTTAAARRGLLKDGASKEEAERLAPYKTFSGNRPSSTILLDRLSPRALGALLAFYEHRTFTAGAIWGINTFDQMGVELGKRLATGIEGALAGKGSPPKDTDPSTRQLIARVKKEA